MIPSVIYLDMEDNTTAINNSIILKKDIIVNDPEGKFFDYFNENFPNCDYAVIRICSNYFY